MDDHDTYVPISRLYMDTHDKNKQNNKITLYQVQGNQGTDMAELKIVGEADNEDINKSVNNELMHLVRRTKINNINYEITARVYTEHEICKIYEAHDVQEYEMLRLTTSYACGTNEHHELDSVIKLVFRPKNVNMKHTSMHGLFCFIYYGKDDKTEKMLAETDVFMGNEYSVYAIIEQIGRI